MDDYEFDVRGFLDIFVENPSLDVVRVLDFEEFQEVATFLTVAALRYVIGDSSR